MKELYRGIIEEGIIERRIVEEGIIIRNCRGRNYREEL